MKVLPIYSYLVLFGGSFIISLGLTPLIRRMAVATRQVAIPKDTRWHKKETALMGGISIFVSFTSVWLLAQCFVDWKTFGLPFLPMIACAMAIFLLGLADDLYDIDPQHKLAGQIIITAILIFSGFGLDWIHSNKVDLFFDFRLDWTRYDTANMFLSILWIVGITNAFNLLDNMDGLSAGIAFIAGIFLFLMHYLNGQMGLPVGPVLLITIVYLGALLGFLIYNIYPASIFMGDAGSLFIGFVLASMTVISEPGRPMRGSTGHLLSVIAIPILIVFVPILDTGFVSFMRKLFRRSILQGGRDHSSHRMVAIGFSERKAVLVLYAFSFASGLIALTIGQLSTGTSLMVIVFYLLFVLFFWVHLAKVKTYSEESILTRTDQNGVTPILIEITYKRRLLEVLLDLILIAAAYYTAYLLRFEGTLGPNFPFFLESLPIIIACQIFWFYIIGVYRGDWQSTSIRDLTDYAKAVTGGTVTSMLALLFMYRFASFSRYVFVIYWIMILVLLSLSRLSFRLLEEGIRKRNHDGRNTLIYGAGIGGQMIVREIERNHELGLAVVGLIDDNPRKHKRKIMGYPVFGGQKGLERIIRKHHIQQIIISFKLNGEEKRYEIKKFCEDLGLDVEVAQMKLMISS
jgi:UDP-GlcNAc:undecaprenyl-phosphate GlcNAc-1-phosphate transferase